MFKSIIMLLLFQTLIFGNIFSQNHSTVDSSLVKYISREEFINQVKLKKYPKYIEERELKKHIEQLEFILNDTSSCKVYYQLRQNKEGKLDEVNILKKILDPDLEKFAFEGGVRLFNEWKVPNKHGLVINYYLPVVYTKYCDD